MPGHLSLFALSLLAACGAPAELIPADPASIADPELERADPSLAPEPVLQEFTAFPLPHTLAGRPVSSRPRNGELGVGLDQPLLLTFFEPMDPVATQAAIELHSDRPPGPVAGALEWNRDLTQATFKPSRPLEYGATIGWSVSTSATTLGGKALGDKAGGSFRAIRLEARQLSSVGPLDGTIDSAGGVVRGGAAFAVGDAPPDRFFAGFLTFDLAGLDPAAARIVAAELSVFQADLAGSPYSLGPLLATGVDYGPDLDPADLSAPAQQTRACPACNLVEETQLLSESKSLGLKTVQATTKVADDWRNRAALGGRSQYRLSFRQRTNGDGGADLAWLYAGEQGARAPTLWVSYEVP